MRLKKKKRDIEWAIYYEKKWEKKSKKENENQNKNIKLQDNENGEKKKTKTEKKKKKKKKEKLEYCWTQHIGKKERKKEQTFLVK